MPFVCPICRDLLEGNISDLEENRIVAGECGHMFHRTCLSTWIKLRQDTNAPNHCPCCRGAVAVSKFIALYPTTCTQSRISEDADNSFELTTKIENLNSSLTLLTEESKSKDSIIADLTNQLKDVTDRNQKLAISTKTWIRRSEQNDRYKTLYANVKAKSERLETVLKSFKCTDKILNYEQPHATIENAKECCIRCTEKLMSENKILSQKLKESKTRTTQLEASFNEINTLYLDANVQLQEFIST